MYHEFKHYLCSIQDEYIFYAHKKGMLHDPQGTPFITSPLNTPLVIDTDFFFFFFLQGYILQGGGWSAEEKT